MSNHPDTLQTGRLVPVIYLAFALYALPAVSSVPGEESFREGLAAYRSDDLITAMTSLERAAKQGHPGAQYLLGFILDNADDNSRARDYYEQSAAQGNADAAYALGVMYSSGDGVERDGSMAVSWFARANQAGHGPAAEQLARAYLFGELGLEVDRKKALDILREAAASGHRPAQALLDAHADESAETKRSGE